VPGPRLTDHDRRQIAAGLAEGLAYAEIARRLKRPTSTITREVRSGGGRDAYQADQAHQAAKRRARRGKALSAPNPAALASVLASGPELADVDEYGRDVRAVRDFERRFAAVLIERGFPRMAARVLAPLLIADAGSLTTAELVARLRVSPASISKAATYLETLRVIRRERDPRDPQGRRVIYRIGDDVWSAALSRVLDGYTVGADVSEEGAEVLGARTPAGARLAEMSQFLRTLRRDIEQAVDHARIAAHGHGSVGESVGSTV
jgi:hypothetical protein